MCGIVGIIGTEHAAREAFLGLTTLQHRGQDAAGILTWDAAGFHQVKNIGLVESVFTRENMAYLTGEMAIGHARYSTIGRGDPGDVQPFLLGYPFGMGMVHNGNVFNCKELAEELRVLKKRRLLTQSDSEVIFNLLADGIAKNALEGAAPELTFEHICKAVDGIFSQVNGSYSIISLIDDFGMIAFRDPHGIRPLVLGRKKVKANGPNGAKEKFAYMLASESVALSFLGYELVRDLLPGEVICIPKSGDPITRVLRKKEIRHCMFEWVYFASPESIIDGIPVYGTRIQLGKNLAQSIKQQMLEKGLEADLVVPVPETSRIAAIALAEELRIPYREVLIKNRYIKRTFILDSQEKRQSAVNLKLSPVKSEIQGKRILLVDDSIVRGTTSRKIIDLVRNAGAAQVYFVSTCPPIQHPCYYGIDFPEKSELIASGKNAHEIERELGADAVIYQDMAGLENSIFEAGGKKNERSRPCMACLNGEYPTDTALGLKFALLRQEQRKEIM